jgi:hypothetical protein
MLPRTAAVATDHIKLHRVLTLHRAVVTQRLVTPRLRAPTPRRAVLTRHPAAATAGEAAVTVAVVEAAEVRTVVEVEAVLTAVVVARMEAALTGTKFLQLTATARPNIGAGFFCAGPGDSASQLFANRGVYNE